MDWVFQYWWKNDPNENLRYWIEKILKKIKIETKIIPRDNTNPNQPENCQPQSKKTKANNTTPQRKSNPSRNYLKKRQLARPPTPTPTQASSWTTPTSTATRTVTPPPSTSTAPSRTKPKKVTNPQAKTKQQSASLPTPKPRKLANLVEHFENFGNHGNLEN